jgi:hypothetical protein
MVWNMVYDPARFDANNATETVGTVSGEEIWRRFAGFLGEMMPVAEKAGVTLALHPDDPPLPALRGAARLVYHPDYYQRVFDLAPSPMNAIEFCVGTVSEMAGADVYEAVDRYSKTGRIAYVHLRNVRGKVPNYHEAFIDDGDTDMLRVLQILHRNGFDGVVIPDHTPLLDCAAPWHASMAHALGWIRAAAPRSLLRLPSQDPDVRTPQQAGRRKGGMPRQTASAAPGPWRPVRQSIPVRASACYSRPRRLRRTGRGETTHGQDGAQCDWESTSERHERAWRPPSGETIP